MKNIPKTKINDEVSELKRNFEISDFVTINNILNSKYSPNYYTKLDRTSINQESFILEEFIDETPDFYLKDYSLKLSAYYNFFLNVIEKIIVNVINDLKYGNIKEIVNKQEEEIVRSAYLIKNQTTELNYFAVFEKERIPYFTNSIIYEWLYRMLDNASYFFREFRILRSDNPYLKNETWNHLDINEYYRVIKKKEILTKVLHPEPEFMDIFFNKDYIKLVIEYKNQNNIKKLTHKEIYDLARGSEKIIFEPIFDFKLTKIELILLISLLYKFKITEPSKYKQFTLHEYFYSNSFENKDINTEREITFFIENYCSINGKRISGVKIILTELRNLDYKHYSALNKLISKLKKLNKIDDYRNIFCNPAKISDFNRLYNVEESPKLILFNFLAKKRIVVCLFVCILNNHHIINFNKYDILSLYQFLENNAIFIKDHRYSLEMYFGEITFKLYDYRELYFKILRNLEKSIENNPDIYTH